MAYASDATHTRGQNPRSKSHDFSPEVGGEWMEPEKAPRDLKKLFLVAGLGILSWVATYVGMLELIEANMGELPLVHKAHHRLLGRHADDHDHLAARPDVRADLAPSPSSAISPATCS